MTAGKGMLSRLRTLGLAASVLIVACGGGGNESSSTPMLGIENIGLAVAALRDQQDAEPRFFEINSTADGVNLFIAVSRSGDSGTPDAVIQGRYTAKDGLVLASELLEASGPVFTFDDMNLDSARLLGTVVRELDNSTPLMFVLTAANNDGNGANVSDPVMRVIMESSRGGRLAVFLASDGTILGTEVLDD